MEKHKVLDQLLMELHRFMVLLDRENLSGNATIQKGLLAELLQTYRTLNGADEEYIYMNKVVVGGNKDKDELSKLEVNGKATKHVPVPQKSLPDLPPPRIGVVSREPFPLPAIPSPATVESYYEEAQPYEETANDWEYSGLASAAWMRGHSSDSVVYAVITRDDGEAVSSSYESYDEEEVTRGKSAQHQWPSAEASIELMKDARICAFLWRKKWLGQWGKQLCVIKEHRLLCYKSSKEQTPLLDVSLLGCSVIYKEKQLKRKEHKLKIMPVGGEAIVLGLQSKEQAEQWLKVIQEISPKPAEIWDPNQFSPDSSKLICTKGELGERHSLASESGSSTDSHADALENKDVKKKYGAGLMFSNLRNIGKKKNPSLESPEKCIETSGYLNVLVNSQWRPCWCLIKNRQLWCYQDKGKSKLSQPAVPLEGCSILPDPNPEHLYSFRIDMDGTQLATLEAKTSADMGHWLGLLLSQTGTKTEPEDLTYDYVNSERISSIVNAAKTSLYLMLRRYSEPNTYIDTMPSISQNSEELYDDVASLADSEDTKENNPPNLQDGNLQECLQDSNSGKEAEDDRIYIDLLPVRSFLHPPGGAIPAKEPLSNSPVPVDNLTEPPRHIKEVVSVDLPEPASTSVSNGPTSPTAPSKLEQTLLQVTTYPQPQTQQGRNSPQSQELPRKSSLEIPKAFISSVADIHKGPSFHHSPQPARPKAHTIGSLCTFEVKLGKNRTEADMLRYTGERDRLEKEREEVKSCLAQLKKERREVKEELAACQDPKEQALLEARVKEKEVACREAESRRVEVELRLMEVKESLKKVEAGPFTLGTTLDSSLQDPPTVKITPSENVNSTKTSTMPSPPQPTSPPAPPPSSSTTIFISITSPASAVNTASALKNRPASIVAPKGNVLQKAKEWEKKSTN
uniref:Actin filament-associated protein 1-like 2 n=1 Tax=Oryzias latipes TaxID=8090 RepID=A0A3P9JK32_ORYLA